MLTSSRTLLSLHSVSTPGSKGPTEEVMIRIKVQYDAENRTFRLVDQEFKTLLEGDALYELSIPLAFEEVDDDEDLVAAGTC
jgi:hypothetical protein